MFCVSIFKNVSFVFGVLCSSLAVPSLKVSESGPLHQLVPT